MEIEDKTISQKRAIEQKSGRATEGLRKRRNVKGEKW